MSLADLTEEVLKALNDNDIESLHKVIDKARDLEKKGELTPKDLQQIFEKTNDKKSSSLHLLALHKEDKYLEDLKFLLEQGINITQLDADDKSALHFTIDSDNPEGKQPIRSNPEAKRLIISSIANTVLNLLPKDRITLPKEKEKTDKLKALIEYCEKLYDNPELYKNKILSREELQEKLHKAFNVKCTSAHITPVLVAAAIDGATRPGGPAATRAPRRDIAAKTDNEAKILPFLVEKIKCDINVTDTYQQNALHYSADAKNKVATIWLLDHGINKDALDKKGKSAIQLLLGNPRHSLTKEAIEIIDIMLQKGVNPNVSPHNNIGLEKDILKIRLDELGDEKIRVEEPWVSSDRISRSFGIAAKLLFKSNQYELTPNRVKIYHELAQKERNRSNFNTLRYLVDESLEKNKDQTTILRDGDDIVKYITKQHNCFVRIEEKQKELLTKFAVSIAKEELNNGQEVKKDDEYSKRAEEIVKDPRYLRKAEEIIVEMYQTPYSRNTDATEALLGENIRKWLLKLKTPEQTANRNSNQIDLLKKLKPTSEEFDYMDNLLFDIKEMQRKNLTSYDKEFIKSALFKFSEIGKSYFREEDMEDAVVNILTKDNVIFRKENIEELLDILGLVQSERNKKLMKEIYKEIKNNQILNTAPLAQRSWKKIDKEIIEEIIKLTDKKTNEYLVKQYQDDWDSPILEGLTEKVKGKILSPIEKSKMDKILATVDRLRKCNHESSNKKSEQLLPTDPQTSTQANNAKELALKIGQNIPPDTINPPPAAVTPVRSNTPQRSSNKSL